MVNHAVRTLFSIVLAIVLFSVPLVLKYHVYRPHYKRVVAGEVMTMDGRFSTVWCQGVEMESKAWFESYLFDSEPAVDQSNVVTTLSTDHLVLPNKAVEYWGFHLLRGSSVNISACSRLPRADVTVVKGLHRLKQCLLDFRRKEKEGEWSGEESASLSESDADTSSISSSQGVVGNETEDPFICPSSLDHNEIPHSYKCFRPFNNVVREHVQVLEVEETDNYYLLFSTNSYLDIVPNEISLQLKIDRSQFNYSASSANCSSDQTCQLDVPFASDVRIVLKVQNLNGTLKTQKLKVSCKPREWIFLIFYGCFFVVIFLCAFQ